MKGPGGRSDSVAGAAWRRYRSFALLAAGIAAATAAAAWVPARNLAGNEAPFDLAAGCGLALAASWLGGLAILQGGKTSSSGVVPTLASTGIRLGLMIVGGVLLCGAGLVSPVPFLIGAALSYGMLLIADTRYALAEVKAMER